MPKILHLKIQLQYITKPPIWRKVEVKDTNTFYDLHNIIQGAMGWDNAHLHHFIIGNGQEYIGIPSPYDDFIEYEDSRKMGLHLFEHLPKQQIIYEYDFGDGWLHSVKLENITETKAGVLYPRLVKGKSTCPPEDCGGPYGYMELREALGNPKTKNAHHKELREWYDFGPDDVLNPNLFDLEKHHKRMLEFYKNRKK